MTLSDISRKQMGAYHDKKREQVSREGGAIENIALLSSANCSKTPTGIWDEGQILNGTPY